MENQNNKKNYLLTLILSFGGMFISAIISFISVPISLSYWQVEKYGMWALISSVLTYLNLSNLGLNSTSSTLIVKNNNFIVKIRALKRTTKILTISVMFFTCCFILLNLYNKKWIFFIGNIPNNLLNETYGAVFWSSIFFLVNVPVSNVSSALTGFQRAYIEKIFVMAGSVFGFIILLITIKIKGTLVTLSILTGLSTLILNLLRCVYFYFKIYLKEQKNGEKYEVSEDKETSYKNIIITSARFFSIGIAAMIVWNTDNLVISHFLSVKDVTPYSVTFKLYYTLFNIIFIVNGSIMPIFGKQIGNNNWEWLNKIYFNMVVIIAILGGITWIGGILFFKDIISVWAGQKAYGGLMVVFALGGYSYLLSIVNLNSSVLNTFNYIRDTVWIGWMEAIINITLSIFFVTRIGIGGAALGTFLGSLLSVTWLLPIVIFKKTNNKLNINVKFLLKHLFFIILPLVLISIVIQIYVKYTIIRLGLGFIIICLYSYLSYKIIPESSREYIWNENLKHIFKKLNINKKTNK